MKMLIDSFWRAVVYCLYPRVIGLSFLPLVLIVSSSWLLGYLYWDVAVTLVRGWLDASSWLTVVWRWLEGVGLADLKTVVAPLLVIFSVTPIVVVASLLAVSFLMTPSLTRMVVDRRFAGLQRKQGGSLLFGLWWTFLSLLLALGALLLTLPMWLVPPLAMLLPALIWGWLTYRVMAFDVLAEFASGDERNTLMARHRMSLLGMGVVTGLMGAAPSLVWASGALFAAAFVILVPLAIWIYTLVFAFSSLWFAHFLLAALQALRNEPAHAASHDAAVPASPHAAARLGAGSGENKADGVTDVEPRPIL
jgi:Etoposide-induced protein 2.4 (EI24)